MPKRKIYDHNSELDHIREDIDSLKNNVVALTRTMQHEVADTASTRFKTMKKKGHDALDIMEKDVRKKPMQSLLTAFGAGVVLSALMRRH